eukprot:GHVT01024820.1.p1 GENE.GHVT01024820.1~~GHVT01024820.1.p1  ORF type:complete len:313 (+),score=85.81 GHVT01024820.1:552-1490(+)
MARRRNDVEHVGRSMDNLLARVVRVCLVSPTTPLPQQAEQTINFVDDSYAEYVVRVQFWPNQEPKENRLIWDEIKKRFVWKDKRNFPKNGNIFSTDYSQYSSDATYSPSYSSSSSFSSFSSSSLPTSLATAFPGASRAPVRPRVWTVRRRFSNFAALHRQLQESFVRLPAPPRKSFVKSLAVDFLESRRRGLDDFLQKLLMRRDVRNDRTIHEFLYCPEQLQDDPEYIFPFSDVSFFPQLQAEIKDPTFAISAFGVGGDGRELFLLANEKTPNAKLEKFFSQVFLSLAARPSASAAGGRPSRLPTSKLLPAP